MCVCVCVCVCVFVCVYTHTCTHTHICTAYTHIHTLTHSLTHITHIYYTHGSGEEEEAYETGCSTFPCKIIQTNVYIYYMHGSGEEQGRATGSSTFPRKETTRSVTLQPKEVEILNKQKKLV
jgi:hypothetical protein